MDKDFWIGFMRFLETANDEEIQDRLKKTKQFLDNGIHDAQVRADAQRIIRFLEQEMIERLSSQKH